MTAASTAYNTTGGITDVSGSKSYSTYQLSRPLDGVTSFGAGL